MLTLTSKEIYQTISDHHNSAFKRLELGDTRGSLTIFGTIQAGKGAWRNLFAEDCVLQLRGHSALFLKANSRFSGTNELEQVDGGSNFAYAINMTSSSLINTSITVDANHCTDPHPQLNLSNSWIHSSALKLTENEQINISQSKLTSASVHHSDISYCEIVVKQPPSVISNSMLEAAMIKVDKLTLQNANLYGIHYTGKQLGNNPLVINAGPESRFVGQLVGTEYMIHDGRREVNLGVWEQHHVANCTNFVLAGMYGVYLEAFKKHRDVCRFLNQH